ncbi:MAG: phosphotransferase [Clostridia bacterium]|nr:phosphotransferase [Clostridia bacterium]
MEQLSFFETLTADWSLGRLSRPPQPVSGGYMHKMFRLDTASGSFAVKLLNPEVMSRPEALGNYCNAEALEQVLEAHHLPIVAALSRNGKKMHCIQGQYFYLFPWVEHKAVPWDAITEKHCRTMGGLLAQLHKLPWKEATSLSAEPNQPAPVAIDWQAMVQQVQTQTLDKAFADTLTQNLPLLEAAQTAYNRAVAALPPLQSICNADMDAKNVLWQGDKPLVIDLECLEIGNPVNDLVQLSLSWAGGVLCQINMPRLEAFLRAYQQLNPLPTMDWEALTGLGFAWLDWLHYNLRRACGLTGASTEEQQLGLQESRSTLERIRFYAQVQPQLAARFRCAMDG